MPNKSEQPVPDEGVAALSPNRIAHEEVLNKLTALKHQEEEIRQLYDAEIEEFDQLLSATPDTTPDEVHALNLAKANIEVEKHKDLDPIMNEKEKFQNEDERLFAKARKEAMDIQIRRWLLDKVIPGVQESADNVDNVIKNIDDTLKNKVESNGYYILTALRKLELLSVSKKVLTESDETFINKLIELVKAANDMVENLKGRQLRQDRWGK